ncbi:MAG: heavy-metal-associated domain-containing protein [Deltaproteobacteria bacterium]|nr:heavy-metal-associated domain-containing protein [Deltaproteobacteria bacterium]
MNKKMILLFLILCIPFTALAETVKVFVPGMVCPLCLVGIQKQFKKDVENPKKDVLLDLENKIVTIHTKKKLSDAAIKQKIKNSGYEVKSIERVPTPTDPNETPSDVLQKDALPNLEKQEEAKKP